MHRMEGTVENTSWKERVQCIAFLTWYWRCLGSSGRDEQFFQFCFYWVLGAPAPSATARRSFLRRSRPRPSRRQESAEEEPSTPPKRTPHALTRPVAPPHLLWRTRAHRGTRSLGLSNSVGRVASIDLKESFRLRWDRYCSSHSRPKP